MFNFAVRYVHQEVNPSTRFASQCLLLRPVKPYLVRSQLSYTYQTRISFFSSNPTSALSSPAPVFLLNSKPACSAG